MNPLEHGQMLKEIFEERINSLKVTEEYFSELKESATTERQKAKYDIMNMENELCLAVLTDRLETLNKVLELNDKIQNDNLSFVEKMDCMMEVIQIMNNL